MHESSLMTDLMSKIESLAHQHQSQKVTRVKIKVGALSHISPEHLREHFRHASRGTVAETAFLDIESSADIQNEHANEILLDSVDIEE